MKGETPEVLALTEEIHGAKGAKVTAKGRPTSEASAELFALLQRESESREEPKWQEN